VRLGSLTQEAGCKADGRRQCGCAMSSWHRFALSCAPSHRDQNAPRTVVEAFSTAAWSTDAVIHRLEEW